MASSYAIPLNPTGEAHHAHSRSHFLADRPPSWISQADDSSAVKKMATSTANGGHRHNHSEYTTRLHNSGTTTYSQSGDRSHQESNSNSYSFSSKSFMRGRPRGESDLGRPATRKGGESMFSPISENPPPTPPPLSTALLELPEALTAVLLPLPFLFASIAYPTVISSPTRPSSGLDGSDDQISETVPHTFRFLHACILSAATLILVGTLSKLFPPEQILDRRKSFGGAEHCISEPLWSARSVGRMSLRIVSIFLPFYAAMQLGGPRTAIVLLTATTAGVGSLDYRPVKHSLWDTWKRTIRTRKSTCAVFLLGIIGDFLGSSENWSTLLVGHLTLAVSVLAIPPPLPSAGLPLMTGIQDGVSDGGWTIHAPSRLSLPKPISPLNSSPQDVLLTLTAGVTLSIFAVIVSMISSFSPPVSYTALLFSSLSIASAAMLIFFSLPSALKTQNKCGLALGCGIVAAFGFFEISSIWKGLPYIPILCALSFAAVTFDTPSTTAHQHAHTHSPSHSRDHGHKHSHGHKHDHHLHGNHSRLSEFLIKRCTPGSIIHSVLLEKDSRRIAYFAVLNLSFMMVQFFYGFVSGSLGLLTDSIHMLFDCAGLAVGLAAAVMSKWHPNVKFPYGYGKIDTLSGFANGIFLMLVSVEIIFDAFERLWEGHELYRLNELLIVSVLGFLVNIVGLTAFGHAHHGHGHDHGHSHEGHDHGHSHSHENENMQGIFLHIMADALGSVAVIISTLLTKYYGWSGWDPIASSIIAVLIFFSALPLVKSSGMRLMLSLPADVEYATRNALQELSSLRGVVGYTTPRFWLEDAGAAHAEVHAHDKHDEHSHDHSHDHSHSHSPHSHSHSHTHDDHCNGHSHTSHDHSHDHNHNHHHSPDYSHHDHSAHNHNHNHEPHSPHGPPPGQQRVLGVIHIIAARMADLEDVRERTEQFLKGRNMEVVVHVEREGEGRCWCGGGNKSG